MGRLLEEFDNHIEELKQLDERIQRKVEKLEQQCHREAKEFAHKVQDLQRSNQVNTKQKKLWDWRFILKHFKNVIIVLSYPHYRWLSSTSRNLMNTSAMLPRKCATLVTSWRG